MTKIYKDPSAVIDQLVEALDHCMDAITERGLNGSPDQAEKWGLQLPLVRAESAITAAQSMLAHHTPSTAGERDNKTEMLAKLTAWLDGLGGSIHTYSLRGIALDGFEKGWDAARSQPTPEESSVVDGVQPVREPLTPDTHYQEWKHGCDSMCTNITPWIDRCPHCGKPRPVVEAAHGITKKGEQ